MAAGLSSRFGENKLLAEFGGVTLIERALDCVPDGRVSRVCVVCSDEQVRSLALRRGFDTVWNDAPGLGASLSLQLGLNSVGNVDGAMFMVCDQPQLTRSSVERLLELFAARPGCIAALSSGGRRGNPCIFPAELFDELRALRGDVGGSAVISRHADRLATLEVSSQELRDVDSREDLDREICARY